MSYKLKTIAISVENYQELKSLGKAGDSFNDVLTQILKSNVLNQNELLKPSSADLAADATCKQ